MRIEDVLRLELADSQILTNGTNLGMAPHEEGCILPMLLPSQGSHRIGYHLQSPGRRGCFRWPRKRAVRISTAFMMLLYQGAEAFRIWTGKDMPVDLIKEKFFR